MKSSSSARTASGSWRSFSVSSRRRRSSSSTCARMETYSPTAIEKAPAARLRNPGSRAQPGPPPAALIPRISETLVTSPSLTPRTAARAVPRCTSAARCRDDSLVTVWTCSAIGQSCQSAAASARSRMILDLCGHAPADAHRAVVAIVEVLQLDFQLSRGAAADDLLDPRPFARKSRDRNAGKVPSPQPRIEREQHLVPEGQVPLRPARLDPGALDEAEVPEGVRGAVLARDGERRVSVGGKLRVLRDEHVERHFAPALGLAEHAEVAREPLRQRVAGVEVEGDGEADGGRPECMRRS